MPSIRILPPDTVNRIAAGEVVERPASVLKELIENSIDAGATRVFVDLEDGGKALILVRDNGSGMAPEDLPLAFASHATSKLSDDDVARNLLGMATLGFRGEALASVASVAMVEVVSRTPGSEHAYRYRPGGGAGELPPEPAAGEPGTTVEVRNLFSTTPARRKFLRSGSAELAHSVQQFTRLALGFPGIHFRLGHARKTLLDLPACGGLEERLRQIVGREMVERLIPLKGGGETPDAPQVTGFTGEPRLHRGDARGQHFFVNGRWIRDRALAHALRSAYQGFQIPGHQPVAYLFVDIAAAEVDVNVHPTKAEVRFREPQDVYRLLHHAVRGALEGRAETTGPSVDEMAASGGDGPAAPAVEARRGVQKAALDFFGAPVRERHFAPAASPRFAGPTPAAGRDEGRTADLESPGMFPLAGGEPAAFQILNSYIVLEEAGGITIIDQHAFHEKVLFEEIHRALGAGKRETQRLLVPEVVDVPAELMPLVDRAREALAPFGLEIDAFGPSSVAIHGVPTVLERGPGRADFAGIVRSVLQSLLDDDRPGKTEAPLHDSVYRIASTMACKRAVKAESRLSPEEISYLLRRGDLARDPRHCPHGRPTTVFFARRDIEKLFDRK